MTECAREDRDNLEGLGALSFFLPEVVKVSLEHFAAASSGLADERQLEEFTLWVITGLLRNLVVSTLFPFSEMLVEFTFSGMMWDSVSVRCMAVAILVFPFIGFPLDGLDDLLWDCLVSSLKLLWLSDDSSLQGLSDTPRDFCVCFPAVFSFGVFSTLPTRSLKSEHFKRLGMHFGASRSADSHGFTEVVLWCWSSCSVTVRFLSSSSSGEEAGSTAEVLESSFDWSTIKIIHKYD